MVRSQKHRSFLVKMDGVSKQCTKELIILKYNISIFGLYVIEKDRGIPTRTPDIYSQPRGIIYSAFDINTSISLCTENDNLRRAWVKYLEYKHL